MDKLIKKSKLKQLFIGFITLSLVLIGFTSLWAANRTYYATSLIGGAAGSLDSFDAADAKGDGSNIPLADNDSAIVMVDSDKFYHYKLDSASGAAESSPYVISPDSNPGTKRWLLIRDIDNNAPNVDSYGGLEAAITAIGATEMTVVVDSIQTLTGDREFVKTLEVIILRGGSIDYSTHALIINGPFFNKTGRYQVFTGTSGSVVYGATSVSDMSYPEWFGENTTPGTTVMDEEIQDAIEMVEGRTYGGTVDFDLNLHLVDTTIDVVGNYIRLIGKGPGTELLRKTDYGTTIDFDNASSAQYYCEIEHMTIKQTTLAMSTGAHIRFDNPYYCEAHHLRLIDGYIGIDQLAGINNRYTDIECQVSETLYPTGSLAHAYYRIWKSADRAFSSSTWMTRCDGVSSVNSDAHVTYGLLITSCDGVWVDVCHIQGGSTANVYVSPSDADSPIGGIRLANSWFDPPGDETGGNSITFTGNTTGNYGWHAIDNCVIDGGNRNNYGIHINSSDVEDVHIISNHITRFGLSGIWGEDFDSDLEIRNNTISGNNYKENAGGYGVLIAANKSNFDITTNTIGGGPLGVAGRQKYGIAVAAGTSNDYTIIGNNCDGNVTGGISDAGTGTNKEVSVNVPVLVGSAVHDFGNIVNGAEEAKDITVTGAALGDYVLVSFSLDVTDLQLTATITAADTVTCVMSNSTGVGIDLASGTLYVRVIER